jgi:hypothetical protein
MSHLPQDVVCESPSIGIICPDIERRAFEAKKTASAAMSAGSTKRLIDWLARAAASSCAAVRPLRDARPSDLMQARARHGAGQDRIDPDAKFTEFARQRLGETDGTPLRRGTGTSVWVTEAASQ